MLFSAVGKKGQTTIPAEVRRAMRIRPGDKLEYEIDGDRVIIRVRLGLKALKGALASDKGRGISFATIRQTSSARRAGCHVD